MVISYLYNLFKNSQITQKQYNVLILDTLLTEVSDFSEASVFFLVLSFIPKQTLLPYPILTLFFYPPSRFQSFTRKSESPPGEVAQRHEAEKVYLRENVQKACLLLRKNVILQQVFLRNNVNRCGSS